MPGPAAYTLQLLHLADGEAGTLALSTAPYLAALADAFDDDYANSITVAGGDNWLPGPFLAAGTDPSLASLVPGNSNPGRTDIAIHNAIGVEVSGIGNHEWDLGSNVFASTLGIANFVSVSANLDFSGDTAVRGLFTDTTATAGLEEASTLKGRIAPSAVVTEGGEKIGFVGVTTQLIEQISSPSGTEVKGFPTGPGPNGEADNMDLLAAQLQPVIDDLIAQGVNKIVLMSHLQLLGNERSLATKLQGVDIIVAAGSNTRLGDADDVAVAFPGHAADFADTYPIVTAGTDGKTSLIVNTDNEYTYLGRLVVDFDANGEIVTDSLTNNVAINGAYASTAENVAEAWGDSDGDLSDTAFAAGTRGAQVKTITDAVQNVITIKDGNVFGYSNVYLEGERGQVRTQETNLGNLSADANGDAARDALGLADGAILVSLKNGGGIRAQIGTISAPDPVDGTVDKLPPEVGGEVSQLDAENALRFNNKLMVFDTTAQGLVNILNHPAALTANNGGFMQIGGVRVAYDPTLPAGQRLRDVVLIDANDNIIATILVDGVLNPDAPSAISVVTLNFTANGGDGYPVKANGENFRYLLDNGTVSAPVSEALDFTATANVPANALGEIQAFQDYLAERYATPGTAFGQADTPMELDTRIENLGVRESDLIGLSLANDNRANIVSGDATDNALIGKGGDDVLTGRGGNDTLDGNSGNDNLFGGDGNDVLSGDSGNDMLMGEDGTDALRGNAGNDTLLGGLGIDDLRGGEGNDRFTGGIGADRLQGDEGIDTFVWTTANDSRGGAGIDTVFYDSDDIFDVSAIDANSTVTGNQAFAFVGTAFTGAAGEIGLTTIGGSTFIAAETDGTGRFDMLILVSATDGSAIVAGDIVL